MKTASFGVAARRNAFIALLSRLLVLACAGLGLGLRGLAADSPRIVLSLDHDWRFHLGEAPDAVFTSFNDQKWRQVDVPHDHVVEGTFSEQTPYPRDEVLKPDWYWLHGFLPVRPAVYRKTFSLPTSAEGKRLWLEFDGVCSNSHYWLNGKLIGGQYSGYTPSRFDVTSVARTGGDNILMVQVDPRYDGWSYEGGGISPPIRPPSRRRRESRVHPTDRVDPGPPLVAGSSRPLCAAQHSDRGGQNRGPGNDQIRRAPHPL